MTPPFVKLGDVIDVLSGFAFKSEFFNDSDGLPVVRIRDVVRGYTDTYYTGPYTEQFVVRDGDILIGMDGNFNAAKWRGGRALLNQRVCKVTARAPLLDEAYLFHYLPIVLRRIEDATPFVTVKHLSAGDLREERIPIPPLAEQRRIAAILDIGDSLRTKRREALAQLDRLAQSIFLEMFGDPKFNPKSWPLKAIESVALDMRGGAALEPEDFVAEGFPVLHKGAIKPAGQIETDPKKKAFAQLDYAKGRPQNIVDRNYVAVTLRDLVPTGPSIGLAANLEDAPQEQYLLAQGAYGVRLDRAQALPEYFVQLSNMPNFRYVLRQHAVGSTQIHIRNPVYLSIRVPLPPVELQSAFASRMRNIRQIGRCADRSLGAFERLFAALQNRAFRGDL